MTSSPTASLSPLESLPPELALRIIDDLAPQAIVRLSATSRALRSIARSEIVWKRIVQAVLARSRATEAEEVESSAGIATEQGKRTEDNEELWWQRASFLLPVSQYLGYFLSSTPYTSRIIRLTTSLEADENTSGPTLTLTAHQVVPSNALSNPEHPEPTIPHGCTLDISRTAYVVPRRGPGSSNPDSGLSVDLLEPRYELLPLFTITEQSGALLSSTPHSSLSPNRFTSTLRLRLQATERDVKVGSDQQSEEERRRSEASNLYSLFTGRTPVLPWPTKELVGVGNLHGESDRVEGAFRGLDEWLIGRGEGRPVLGDSREGAPSSNGSLGFISGFSLQIRRLYDPTFLPGSFPSTSTARPPSPDLQALADEAPRRHRGVGANGGPAVLWNGEEDDPEAAGGVAVLRANDDAGGPGGFVFRIPRIPTQRVPAAEEQFVGEEIVRTDREEFYPIKPPSRPLSFDVAASTAINDEISAVSLEGLWVGTYGGHGLEFGYLSLKLAPEDPNADEGETRVYNRVMDFTKVTGDSNVPSGQVLPPCLPLLAPAHLPLRQISWTAMLPSLSLPPTTPLCSPSTSLGTIPSVSNADLLRWAAYDPSDPRSSSADIPRWETGAVAGAGRVALSGFVNPGWTSAVITFVRSSTVVQGPCGEEGVVESVEEIRVRWAELGKVGVFKRVRM